MLQAAPFVACFAVFFSFLLAVYLLTLPLSTIPYTLYRRYLGFVRLVACLATESPNDECVTPVSFRAWIVEQYGQPEVDVASKDENVFGDRRLSDGLLDDWIVPSDRYAWCNPPYSQKPLWIKIGLIQAALHQTRSMFLLPASTGEGWFHHLALQSRACLLLSPRVAFVMPDGSRSSPRHCSALFFVGPWPSSVRREIQPVRWKL